jgi:hypothetical protein
MYSSGAAARSCAVVTRAGRPGRPLICTSATSSSRTLHKPRTAVTRPTKLTGAAAATGADADAAVGAS